MSGSMHEQEQFLRVLDRDEAERRFRSVLNLAVNRLRLRLRLYIRSPRLRAAQ